MIGSFGRDLMAKWIVGTGIDNYISDLQNLLYNSEESAKRAVYVGAGIVTDEIRGAINGLPIGQPRQGKVTSAQKAGLLAGLGISSFKVTGSFINVKVGMDGYNSMVTKKYPKGQPNALIARSLESGTSFSPRHAFIGPAVARSQKRAEEAIAKQLEEEIKKSMS